MGTLNGLKKRMLSDEGYIEKASNKDLDSKTGNRGSGNYTKYSRDVNAWGLNGCQGQLWCCTPCSLPGRHMNSVLMKPYAIWNITRETYVGYNCFATYNAFKKAGKVGITPRLGAVVIFSFSHAGRVARVFSKDRRE